MHPRFAFVVLTGLVLLLAVVRPAGAEEKPSEPVVPAAVRVPPGHKLLARAEAKGVQIYKSVAGTDRTLAWVLEAPLADLFSREGQKVGYHYAGPSWEAADGSMITRDKAQAVQTAAAPNAQDDIPYSLAAHQSPSSGGPRGHLHQSSVYSASRHARRAGACRGSQASGDAGRRGIPGHLLFLWSCGLTARTAECRSRSHRGLPVSLAW
jgi:hypothetical protein